MGDRKQKIPPSKLIRYVFTSDDSILSLISFFFLFVSITALLLSLLSRTFENSKKIKRSNQHTLTFSRLSFLSRIRIGIVDSTILDCSARPLCRIGHSTLQNINRAIKQACNHSGSHLKCIESLYFTVTFDFHKL